MAASETVMTDRSLDELGPVDYLVVEFPAGASNFTGEMAKELLALVDSGTIRVIDVLILTKNEDGTVEAKELSDVGELGALEAVEAQLAELLAAEDVENLAAAMEPGSTAGVLIWENLWAAPFASAARRSGGQLIANGRIPIQAIIASIEADEALRPKETEMPLRPARVGRVGVIGAPGGENRGRGQGRHPGPAPVAKTAVVAAAVTPGRAVAAGGSSAGLLAAAHKAHRRIEQDRRRQKPRLIDGQRRGVEPGRGRATSPARWRKELLALVDAGTIRVIDILILTKNEDGTVEPMELSDVGELGELQALEAQLAELLAEEDVLHLAAAMEPGSTAGVLIWENLWAAPFASAARRSGGQLIANGRIPIQAIIASIEADEPAIEGD